jgi:hypothetical protein
VTPRRKLQATFGGSRTGLMLFDFDGNRKSPLAQITGARLASVKSPPTSNHDTGTAARWRVAIQRNRPFVGNRLWVVPVTDPDGYHMEFSSPTDAAEDTELEE